MMPLSSPNRIIWVYFSSLLRIRDRVGQNHDEDERKQDIALGILLAVATVEAFLNTFFRRLVENPPYSQHRQLVLDDLDEAQRPRGLRSKLGYWPPTILGKSLAWQSGVAKAFDELRLRRNALMHFTSSHESLTLPGLQVQGLAATDAYDDLDEGQLRNALDVAYGMVAEILRLSGVEEEKMFQAMIYWTGQS